MVEAGESLESALKREIYEESGDLTTSSESIEVGWFSMEEALQVVENVLTKKRLENMLSNSSEMHSFHLQNSPLRF